MIVYQYVCLLSSTFSTLSINNEGSFAQRHSRSIHITTKKAAGQCNYHHNTSHHMFLSPRHQSPIPNTRDLSIFHLSKLIPEASYRSAPWSPKLHHSHHLPRPSHQNQNHDPQTRSYQFHYWSRSNWLRRYPHHAHHALR